MLAQSFGGIGERWNEPETTWLLNLHMALTLGLARDPLDLSAYEGRSMMAGCRSMLPSGTRSRWKPTAT